MPFNDYKNNKYIDFLILHEETIPEIYKHISESLLTTTQIGTFIKLDYYATARKLKLRKFTTRELIKILKNLI